MRRFMAMGLLVLTTGLAVGADRPIPQDAQRMGLRSRERLAWNRRTVGEAYDRVGKKDPRWDEPAREALDVAARMFAQQGDPPVMLADVQKPAKRAVEAGCDDPMILYLYARSSGGAKPEEYRERIERAADAMTASGYPPIRRATALLIAADNKTNQKDATLKDREEVGRDVEAALDLLPRSVAEDPRGFDWEDAWDRLLKVARADAGWAAEGDVKAGFDRVDARLAKIRGVDALRLATKGDFYIGWAWDARTAAIAPLVGEEQFRAFHERLEQARAALEEAYRLNPNQPNVAQRMLTVEIGIGGDREAMEVWFERAMKADGNDREACLIKLDWLDPKWHGGESTDEMIAFGRACWATKNWRNGLSMLVADAHFRHASRLEWKELVKYLHDLKIHSEICEAIEEHLKHHPDDYPARSRYATLCYLGGWIGQAHAQFEILGDHLSPWQAFPNYPLATLKEFRATSARKMADYKAGKIPHNPPKP